LFFVSKRKALVMSQLEKVLESIAHGAEEVRLVSEKFDLESVRRLMAACLAESSKVKKLELWVCGLDGQAVEVIASSLRNNSVLTELSLDGNKDIGPRGAQVLCEFLCVNSFLKLLGLRSCNVGDEGAGRLAVAMRQNRTLEGLFVGNNGITHVGAAAIAAALPCNQTLKRLFLSNNPLGDDGVEVLAKAVPHSGLRKLWLFGAEFGARGCAALVGMLKNRSRLQKLSSDSNHWPALEEGFRCNGWLLDRAPDQYLERNKAMHLQARKSVCMLLLIRKLRRTALSSFPKEVLREIAQFVYSSRGEISVWQANKQ
jgi:Ran GTPase-activating protein (RanGAP) involved in mRNA processing and transport